MNDQPTTVDRFTFSPYTFRMEADPDNQEQKKVKYEDMPFHEEMGNRLADFFEGWQAKRHKRTWQRGIKKARREREFREYMKGRTETIARGLGDMNPAQIEKKRFLTDNERTTLKSIWTILWATPFIRSANKFDRRWKGAKDSIWNKPVSALRELPGSIFSAMVSDIENMVLK